MKTIASACAAALLAGASFASADEIKPMAAASVTLVSMQGVAYYTAEPDGFRVVATFADGETGTPIRFTSMLAEGQSVRIAVPRPAGQSEAAVEISRDHDRVFMRDMADQLTATATN